MGPKISTCTKMASYATALLLLSFAVLHEGAFARKLKESACNFDKVFSLRSEWDSVDEPCHKKLSFELWTFMKAEGSAQSADAQYVRENCIQTQKGGLVELATPKGYTMSKHLEAAPGDVVSETQHATTYQGATATTFQAFCEDDDITQVARVSPHLNAYRSLTKKKPRRRLQATTSEAGQAHEVAELITGLADLGCTRTIGEDQTVCVMSDSFNHLGFADALRSLGDLPLVEVIKELPVSEGGGIDEGSAMLEIMYDIAPGATYKFNTAYLGEQTFADDIGVLANEEACDIIVDDIGYNDTPAFRDGVIAAAADAAVDSGSLYFTAGGNSGTALRFSSNFECATGFEDYFTQTPACGTGVASHVFQPDATGIDRYLYNFEASEWTLESFWLHWDADIGTTEDVWIALWYLDSASGTTGLYSYSDYYNAANQGKAVEALVFEPFLLDDGTPDPNYVYGMQIIHLGLEVGDLDTEFFMVNPNNIDRGQSDGALFGQPCATNAIVVAAMDWAEGDGPGGAFEDPETSPVEGFSSRGPCIVNGETRAKPDTTAANAVATTTPGFEEFEGTSAAAPAAGAIASIVRAACFPKVVGHAEMMEMLTNYDYTIDLTSDADGAPETWGAEGGYGIISASKMLSWVAENCGEACPGASPPMTEAPVAPTAEPTNTPEAPVAPTPKPTNNPTEAPVAPTAKPTNAPTEAPVAPTVQPTDAYTEAPVAPTGEPTGATPETRTEAPVAPTAEPTNVRTDAPVAPTVEPTDANTEAPVAPTAEPTGATPETRTEAPVAPTAEPTNVPTGAPVALTVEPTDAPTEAPVAPTREPTGATPDAPTEAPGAPTATPETPSPAVSSTPAPVEKEEPETPAPEESEDGYVEAGTKTTISVTATAYDERPGSESGDVGCGEDGCLPALAHDGIGEEDLESRWSCSKDIVPNGGQCEIEFTFGSRQDIVDVEVDFYKGDQRKRTLKVTLDGRKIGEYDTDPGSISTSLGIRWDGVKTVTLESVGIDEDEWISLLEVRFMVKP